MLRLRPLIASTKRPSEDSSSSLCTQSLIYTEAVRENDQAYQSPHRAVELFEENNFSSNEVQIHPVEEAPDIAIMQETPPDGAALGRDVSRNFVGSTPLILRSNLRRIRHDDVTIIIIIIVAIANLEGN